MNPILASLIFGEQAQAQAPVLDQYLYGREPAAAKPVPKAKPATANLKGAAPAKPKTPEEVIAAKPLNQLAAEEELKKRLALEQTESSKMLEANVKPADIFAKQLRTAYAASQGKYTNPQGAEEDIFPEGKNPYAALRGQSQAASGDTQKLRDQYKALRDNPLATMDFSPLIDFWNRQTGSKVTYKPTGQALLLKLQDALEKSKESTTSAQKQEIDALDNLIKYQNMPPNVIQGATKQTDITDLLNRIKGLGAGPTKPKTGALSMDVEKSEEYKTARARAAFGKAMNDYYGALDANGLAKTGYSSRDLEAKYQKMVAEGKELARAGKSLTKNEEEIVKGGLPEVHSMKGAVEGLKSAINFVTDPLLGVPVGIGGREGAMKFYQNAIEENKRNIENSRDMLLSTKDEAKAPAINRAYDELVRQTPSTGISEADKAAMDFVKNNPNDPRSAKIKEMLVKKGAM